MQQQIVLAIVLVVLFGTVCEARLPMEEPIKEGRALNLDPVTEAMAYINFETLNACEMVRDTWHEELWHDADAHCVYRDHCASSFSIRVMTEDVDCMIGNIDSDIKYEPRWIDFNGIRFEHTLIASDGGSTSGSPRVGDYNMQPVAPHPGAYTCPQDHHCAQGANTGIYRLKFRV